MKPEKYNVAAPVVERHRAVAPAADTTRFRREAATYLESEGRGNDEGSVGCNERLIKLQKACALACSLSGRRGAERKGVHAHLSSQVCACLF